MSYEEDSLLPISAIQHFLFCPRQCALIHVERIWEENVFTAKGRIEHSRVDEISSESRRDLHIARGLPLRSLNLGIAGRADVVEFWKSESQSEKTIALPGRSGFWRPYPVEYKHGRPKPGDCDKAQLCAQAICLEEMLNVSILTGALFYHSTRKRQEVGFLPGLRTIVVNACQDLHELFEEGKTPPPHRDKRCGQCSLEELCLPRFTDHGKKVGDYIDRSLMDEPRP